MTLLTGQYFRTHEKWKKESIRRKTVRSKIKTANKQLKRQNKVQSKLSPVTPVAPASRSTEVNMGQPRLNISLKPDGVIVREMKKYKVHRPKTFIQISRNKTMVSPKITSSLRKPFYLQSMDLLRYFFTFHYSDRITNHM